MTITDLDAKHKTGDTPKEQPPTLAATKSHEDVSKANKPANVRPTRSYSSPQPPTIQEVTCERPKQTSPIHGPHHDCLPHFSTAPPMLTATDSYNSMRSISTHSSAFGTPTTTPSLPVPASARRTASYETARHARGTCRPRAALDQRHVSSLFSQSAPSMFQTLLRRMSSNSTSTSTDSSSGPSTAPPTPSLQRRTRSANSILPHLAKHNTYESRTGSHVVLEFADPTSSPQGSPNPQCTPATTSVPLSRATSWQGPHPTSSPHGSANGWSSSKSADNPNDQANGRVETPTQTRLQATFEALKRMSTGLGSPRADYSPRKSENAKTGMVGEEGRSPGYFDVVVEEAGA